MREEAEALAIKILRAHDYTEIFPVVEPAQQEEFIKLVYRELAKEVHPDRATGEIETAMLTSAFAALSKLRDEATKMLAVDRYGEREKLAVIRSRKATHEVIRKLAPGDIAAHYQTKTTRDGEIFDTRLKVAKTPRDNDLLAAESSALKKLHAIDAQWTRAYPRLLDSFMAEGRRRANAIENIEDVYTLDELYRMHPTGLDPRHVVWIWRKLLMAIAYAHDQKIIHGAVVPDHILVGPQNHSVHLVDWCYSVDMKEFDSESKTPIKAITPGWKHLYPDEVLSKTAASPATDIYMAAHSLWELFRHTMPRPLRAFIRGCMQHVPRMRPQDAWALLGEFDDALVDMGDPFYPRRWVDLKVPV